MTAALALPSAQFQLPAETTLNIGSALRRKLNTARQFVQSATATTARTAHTVGKHVRQNWKPMAASMVAGAGFQMAVTKFAAAGLATVLPGAAVTIIGGAVAGAGVVMVKKGVDVYFYNLAHKDEKKSYLKELTSRETVIKALTGGVGGALGAQLLASNPAIMEGLQSMGHKTAIAMSAVGASIGRRLTETFAGTAIHNALSKEGRKTFREAFFSKSALLGSVFGAAAGFVGGEVVANHQAIGEALRTPGKLASTFSLSSMTEKAGSALGRAAETVGSVFGALFGISSAHAQTNPAWLAHQVACPQGTPRHMICVDDPVNVLPPALRQQYIREESFRTGRSIVDLSAPATTQPIDQVRAGRVPTRLDDARSFVPPGNAPLTGTPRPIDQIRRGEVPTVLDDPRNMVAPRNLQRNGFPRPIDQVRVGEVPTVLDDVRSYVPPVNASTGSRGVIGNQFPETQATGRAANLPPPAGAPFTTGAQPTDLNWRFVPEQRAHITVQPLPPPPGAVAANEPVGRWDFIPDRPGTGGNGQRPDALVQNRTAAATAAPLTPNARVQQAFDELRRHGTTPVAQAVQAPSAPVSTDILTQLPQATQTNVQRAVAGALAPAAAMGVLKEASFELINRHQNPDAGRELLRRGVEISQANGLAATPVGQQLNRDLAYMDRITGPGAVRQAVAPGSVALPVETAARPAAALPLPPPPPPLAVPSVASNVTALIAPEALAQLPQATQAQVRDALTPGQMSSTNAIRVLKDASFQLINQHHNPEAGMELLRRGVAMSNASGLGDTPVGRMLTRDLSYMERISGPSAVRPASQSSITAPLAARAA